jgi:hypothetical protein
LEVQSVIAKCFETASVGSVGHLSADLLDEVESRYTQVLELKIRSNIFQRISTTIYSELRLAMSNFARPVIKKAITYAESANVS